MFNSITGSSTKYTVIKNMILTFCLKNTSCENVLLRRIISLFWNCDSFIFIVNKIFCRRQRPFKRFKGTWIPRISLMKHIECAIMVEWHTVSKVCVIWFIKKFHFFLLIKSIVVLTFAQTFSFYANIILPTHTKSKSDCKNKQIT